MSRQNDIAPMMRLIGGTAFAALLFDLPFRFIALLGLIPAAGPKNMLPILFGLLYGPAGAAGAGLGMLLAGMIAQEGLVEILVEGLAAVVSGAVAYAVWYLLPVRTHVRCKTGRDVFTVLLCIIAAALAAALVVAGAPGLLWETDAMSRAAQIGGSTVAWSILLGIPCLITATSMFGIVPAAPKWWLTRHADCDAVDLEQTVINTPESIAEMSDAIDMLALTRGIDPKQSYAMMGCVEELNCLILQHLPENGMIRVQLMVSDSLVMRLRYAGERYNPLAIRLQPGGALANMDTMGILLVREMAVYAKHSYHQGENEIRIIV